MLKAVAFAVTLGICTATGLIHTFSIDEEGSIIPALPGQEGYWPTGPLCAAGYIGFAVFLFVLYALFARKDKTQD